MGAEGRAAQPTLGLVAREDETFGVGSLERLEDADDAGAAPCAKEKPAGRGPQLDSRVAAEPRDRRALPWRRLIAEPGQGADPQGKGAPSLVIAKAKLVSETVQASRSQLSRPVPEGPSFSVIAGARVRLQQRSAGRNLVRGSDAG
jgi:hypothetical protein